MIKKRLKRFLLAFFLMLAVVVLVRVLQIAFTDEEFPKINFGELLQFIITGISVGMVYALIALGFALIWKSSSVANLALGQIVLISSWFTYSMFIQASFPA